ncbi:MAG: TonB-dependent receptor [Acidobacteriia bacterium]|nr:TonB-dependent receptor [Terriglobia bacterium]
MSTRLLTTIGFLIAGLAQAQRVGAPTDDLANTSVDDLFRLEVTSVGRKAQQLSKAPAAVYVLTADDIRRTGATSIPEALEWVPGLTVLRVDGRSWAISARGSARVYSDKMLVMIDGRSLYTPLFSGVLWDLIDVPLENIERIEIVRGPGAVMWGPNAVNGVINIITKKAAATKGGELSAAAGNELRGSVFGRWSSALGDKFAYQVWTKLEDRQPAFSSPGYHRSSDGFVNQEAQPVDDLNSQSARVGFRLDGQLSAKDQLMVAGDAYTLGRHDALSYPVLLPLVTDFVPGHTGDTGGFLQALWTRTSSVGNESSLQFTYDKNRLSYPFIDGDLNNLTIDYQKRVQTGDRNEVYWGAGYQQYWDYTGLRRFVTLNPRDSIYRVGDVVIRDEFQLVPNRLLASAGVRLDYNSYTHFEFQPSLRLLYTPNARQSFWMALSRAVRVPSRIDRDMQTDDGARMVSGVPVHLETFGSRALRSEIERSVEAGYRVQSGQRWSADVSVFWSRYEGLAAVSIPDHPQIQWAGPVPTLSMNLTERNGGTGRSYGGETSATWQVTPSWRLIPSYSYLNETKWLPPAYSWLLNTSSPRHQGFIRSQHDLSRTLQFDLMARARSRNPTFDLPGVVLVDARLGWRPYRDGEFSISVQNLTGRTVLETYSESPFVAIPLQRTFVFKWTQKL